MKKPFGLILNLMLLPNAHCVKQHISIHRVYVKSQNSHKQICVEKKKHEQQLPNATSFET